MTVIRAGFVLGQLGWLGGVNYFRNLFTAIQSSPDVKIQPVVFVGLKTDASPFEGLAEIIRTPILDHYTISWWTSKILSKSILRRDYLIYWLLRKHQIGVLSHYGQLWRGCSIPSLGWIGDFQHLHLPELLGEKGCATLDAKYTDVIRHSDAVLLSSQDALNDLNSFCPCNTTPTHILRFVSCLHPNLNELPDRAELEVRYKLDRPWFHIPNQFWAHKNHGVVVEALRLLKAQGSNILVIATGSTSDHRNAEYFPSLMNRVNDYGLRDNFRALGVLPYTDVVALLRHSVAVINPSLFEGWSTSVEESKAMGKQIILTDIAVHREQNPGRGLYFKVDDPSGLAALMEQIIQHFSKEVEDMAMEKAQCQNVPNRVEYAKRYFEILTDVCKIQTIPLPNCEPDSVR